MRWRENGNPLQCSCLENPRDRGAWWAAIYGVAQSRIHLTDWAAAAENRRWLKSYHEKLKIFMAPYKNPNMPSQCDTKHIKKQSSILKLLVAVQLLSLVQLFATPWAAACQASCPSLSPGICSNSCPLSRWCHTIISYSAPAPSHILLLLSIFPSIRVLKLPKF